MNQINTIMTTSEFFKFDIQIKDKETYDQIQITLNKRNDGLEELIVSGNGGTVKLVSYPAFFKDVAIKLLQHVNH